MDADLLKQLMAVCVLARKPRVTGRDCTTRINVVASLVGGGSVTARTRQVQGAHPGNAARPRVDGAWAACVWHTSLHNVVPLDVARRATDAGANRQSSSPWAV